MKKGRRLVILNSIKNFWILGIIFWSTVAASGVSFVNITCENVGAEYIGKEDKNHVFVVKQRCILNNSGQVSYKKLIQESIKSLKGDDTYSKVDVNENSKYENYSAVHMDLTQERKLKHGNMKIFGDMYLFIDEQESYRCLYNSRRIKATGNAANTMSVSDFTHLSPEATGYSVNFRRVVKVNKPWYAPIKVFISEVKKGIINDFPELTIMQLSIIKKSF